jgi:type VI secretion system secreted protein VgrG
VRQQFYGINSQYAVLKVDFLTFKIANKGIDITSEAVQVGKAALRFFMDGMAAYAQAMHLVV